MGSNALQRDSITVCVCLPVAQGGSLSDILANHTTLRTNPDIRIQNTAVAHPLNNMVVVATCMPITLV